jgi:hypothetical protein
VKILIVTRYLTQADTNTLNYFFLGELPHKKPDNRDFSIHVGQLHRNFVETRLYTLLAKRILATVMKNTSPMKKIQALKCQRK